MAHRAPSRCTKCPAIATHHGRCDDHQRVAWENPSANTRTLTSAQRAQARRYMISRGHVCAVCGEDDPDRLELDHITEIEDGGAHEPANWQLLCKRHHAHKSLLARRARSARRKAAQGR